ncbi:hypothetical protein KGM_210280 [Danaus plexippus plexippus]|uniref:Uncharacterized protein n=1 Tax=Danaus plexippus plexippus TaxID=278856 RepID=A0A212FBE9_DANPL|nr:hypothetical protein KGM_210280 [Danaus plexippus plexippus]
MSDIKLEQPRKKEFNKEEIGKTTDTRPMDANEELDLGCNSFFNDCFNCCCGCEKFDAGSGYQSDDSPNGGWNNSDDYINDNNSENYDSGDNDCYGNIDTNFGDCDSGGGFESGGCDSGGGFDSGTTD